MTLAIVFALEAEWAPWRARHAFRRVTNARWSTYEATIGHVLVRVAASGVGAPRVHELADVACAGKVDALAVVGLAGALKTQYASGDIIVARQSQSGALGTSVASDTRLVALASHCGATIVDVLLSVDRVVGRAPEKRQLAGRADAVDMESFVILSEASRRGIRGVAIRAIGDSADEDLPLDFGPAIRADGTSSMTHLLRDAARRPQRWPALVAFGWRQRRALARLAAFLDRFVAELH